MRARFYIPITVLIIALLAWSPWLTISSANVRAVEAFNSSWTSVIDGCGTSCKGCGAVEAQRVPFGVKVTLEYGCGLMPADTAQYHERATGFVSFFGTVHGFPHP